MQRYMLAAVYDKPSLAALLYIYLYLNFFLTRQLTSTTAKANKIA
jgi:hypothetical protein